MIKEYYGGFNSKTDSEGGLYPWWLSITDGKNKTYCRQIKLPLGHTWITYPRHPVWGDLFKRGETLEIQVEEITKHLPLDVKIHFHARHTNELMKRIFHWNGIDIVFHDIDIINTDHLRIGDEAGCEISSLITNIKLKRMLETL